MIVDASAVTVDMTVTVVLETGALDTIKRVLVVVVGTISVLVVVVGMMRELVIVVGTTKVLVLVIADVSVLVAVVVTVVVEAAPFPPSVTVLNTVEVKEIRDTRVTVVAAPLPPPATVDVTVEVTVAGAPAPPGAVTVRVMKPIDVATTYSVAVQLVSCLRHSSASSPKEESIS